MIRLPRLPRRLLAGGLICAVSLLPAAAASAAKHKPAKPKIATRMFNDRYCEVLAVHGTVNDLAMSGARPLYLSAAFIIEEGLPLADLARIVAGEKNRRHHIGVGGKGQTHPVNRHHRLILQFFEVRVAEGGQKQLLNKVGR